VLRICNPSGDQRTLQRLLRGGLACLSFLAITTAGVSHATAHASPSSRAVGENTHASQGASTKPSALSRNARRAGRFDVTQPIAESALVAASQYSISNFGPRYTERNAVTLAAFDVGATFSGSYDPVTQMFLIQPSGSTAFRSGKVPPNRVPKNGGHLTVSQRLAKLTGGASSRMWGFVVRKAPDETFRSWWFSKSLNEMNHQEWLAPPGVQEAIRDSLQRATARKTSDGSREELSGTPSQS
jgi:hypothetical protein